MKKIFIIVALVLAVVVIASGIAGIAVGQAKSHNLSNRLKTEAVSLRTFDTNAPADAIVTNAAQAQLAADTLDKHRKLIAPTYAALLNGQKFDPTNPKDLTYAQAMNLEDSMNLAVLGFGVTTVLTLIGVLMIVLGVALVAISMAVWVRPKRDGAKPVETTV
jgi:Flp pilus assembly protein TadB